MPLPTIPSATKLRYQGTGNWFIDGQEFSSGYQPGTPSHGCMQSLEGAKGFWPRLASTGIDWLRDHKKSSEAALAYVHCDYKDKQKQSPTKIVNTLLWNSPSVTWLFRLIGHQAITDLASELHLSSIRVIFIIWRIQERLGVEEDVIA